MSTENYEAMMDATADSDKVLVDGMVAEFFERFRHLPQEGIECYAIITMLEVVNAVAERLDNCVYCRLEGIRSLLVDICKDHEEGPEPGGAIH